MLVNPRIIIGIARYSNMRRLARASDWVEDELENIGEDAAIDYMQMRKKAKRIYQK